MEIGALFGARGTAEKQAARDDRRQIDVHVSTQRLFSTPTPNFDLLRLRVEYRKRSKLGAKVENRRCVDTILYRL